MLYYNHQKEVRPDLLKVTDSQPQKGHGEYYEGTYGEAECLYRRVLQDLCRNVLMRGEPWNRTDRVKRIQMKWHNAVGVQIPAAFLKCLLTTYTHIGYWWCTHGGIEKREAMSKLMGKMELLLKLGGMKEDITFLVISGAAVKMEEKEAWRKIFSSAPALHPARQRRCVRSRGRNRGLFRLLRPSSHGRWWLRTSHRIASLTPWSSGACLCHS